jgi:hypothetical protein
MSICRTVVPAMGAVPVAPTRTSVMLVLRPVRRGGIAHIGVPVFPTAGALTCERWGNGYGE